MKVRLRPPLAPHVNPRGYLSIEGRGWFATIGIPTRPWFGPWRTGATFPSSVFGCRGWTYGLGWLAVSYTRFEANTD